jgi:hypothetical protein
MATYKLHEITFDVIGLGPVMLHNGNDPSPLNPFGREIKRIKAQKSLSEEDKEEQIQRAEFLNGIYWSECPDNNHVDGLKRHGHVILPFRMIRAAIIEGGKQQRLGTELKRCLQMPPTVEYGWPLHWKREPAQRYTAYDLFDAGFFDRRAVRVQTARITRVRPFFRDWNATCQIRLIESSKIDPNVLHECVKAAGLLEGIGDARALGFGRFRVANFKSAPVTF